MPPYVRDYVVVPNCAAARVMLKIVRGPVGLIRMLKSNPERKAVELFRAKLNRAAASQSKCPQG